MVQGDVCGTWGPTWYRVTYVVQGDLRGTGDLFGTGAPTWYRGTYEVQGDLRGTG